MTLGAGGRGPQARSVPQGPAVWLWRRRRFGLDSYSFLVGSESGVRHLGAVARRPGPSLRALLFWCGGGAVCEAFGGWKTAETACFLVSDVRHWGPWPAGPVRPSGSAVWLSRRRRFGSDSYSFLVGAESDVRHWGPWPAGPVRPSGPCCLAVAQAPFWVRQLVFL